MITLYPSIKKISALFIAISLCTGASAQKETYATLDRKAGAVEYASVKKNIIERVIKVKAVTENRVILCWAPAEGVSHYVVERSTDGKRFEEVGLFFTGEWATESEFIFTDKFRKPYGGPLFYRLRVVGQEESSVYTPPTIINTDKL